MKVAAFTSCPVRVFFNTQEDGSSIASWTAWASSSFERYDSVLVIPAPSNTAVVEAEAVDDTDTDRSTPASKLFFGGRGGMQDTSSPACFIGRDFPDGVGIGVGVAVAVAVAAPDWGSVPFPGKQSRKNKGEQESRSDIVLP